MATDRSSYFPDNVLEPIFSAEPVKVPKFTEIYVGIDPASHNSSSMGLSAIGVKDGTIFLMGLASVKIERADVREVSQSITVFLERLREHPAIGAKSSFLPIVEVVPTLFLECNAFADSRQVNGNEPYAQSLVNSFAECPPYRNPFSRAVYKSKVSPGVGVWTTRQVARYALFEACAHPIAGRPSLDL
jgi:hypothetical protein